MKWIIPLLMASTAFADPLSLAEAVRRAVERHPNIESAKASLRAAAAKGAEVKAAYRPRIDYQESFVRSNNPVFVFGSLLTQRQFGPANFAIDALNRPDALNNFQSLITAEQMLWDGGRTRKAHELAEIGKETAAAALRQMELAMASHTARAYLDAQLTRAAIPVAEQAVKAAEADLAKAEAAQEAGRATAADALSVKVHLAAMREQLVMRRAEAKVAESVLRELTGLGPNEAMELSTSLDAVSADLPAAASLDRPELAQKRLEVDAARKQGELARLAWMPQVGARLGFEADRQRFVTRAGSNWLAAVSLKWTPYQGGAEQARIRMAVESQRAAEASASATERRLQVEVEQATTMLEASRTRLESAAAAIAAAEESLRITQDRYDAGLATITELLRTETALLEARLRLLAARHGLRTAQLNQAAALGRLNPESEVLQ